MWDDDDGVDRLIQCVKCFVPKMSKSQIVQAFSETSKSQIFAAFSKMFKSQIVHAFSKLILYLVVVKIILSWPLSNSGNRRRLRLSTSISWWTIQSSVLNV